MREVTYNFTGKRYVVTGASSGMGRQVALELAEAGATVLAIARREEELEKLKLINNHIEYAVCDVNDIEAVDIAIKNFVQEHGKLNGSVFAAGVSDITPLKCFDRNIANQIVNVSFWAAIDFIQLVMKKKYSDTGTSNLIFSSVSGYSGEKGLFAYSAAKAAIRIAVKSLAKEICSRQHRINTISPGWVRSDMTKKTGELADLDSFLDKHLLGTGEVDDVSGMVLFLLSDRAKWITGTDIVVDGGYLA